MAASLGLALARVFLRGIALLAEIGVAEERVVVEADLGVEREELFVLQHDQWVYFRERAVRLDEAARERRHEADGGADLLLRETQTEGEAPPLVGREAHRGVDGLAQDLLRRARRHLLDLDAALGRRHDGHPPALPVDHHAEVHLARDGAALLDEEPAHHPALRPGLVRDQRLPEELRGGGARRRRVPHQLDAARLPAPAGVDLRLHDAREAEALGGGDRFVDLEARLAVGDRDAVAAQQVLRLVLVDVHRRRSPC